MLRGLLILLVVFAVGALAFAAGPEDDSSTINIMKPEPGTPAAKHQRARKSRVRHETAQPQGFGVKEDTRRGSSDPVYPAPLPAPEHPLPVPRIEAAPQRPATPPPLYVPQTGRTLPNMPATGSGPGGAETFQDRSARCAHQAGVYGPSATGNPGTYIGSCINQ